MLTIASQPSRSCSLYYPEPEVGRPGIRECLRAIQGLNTRLQVNSCAFPLESGRMNYKLGRTAPPSTP